MRYIVTVMTLYLKEPLDFESGEKLLSDPSFSKRDNPHLLGDNMFFRMHATI